MAEEANNRIAAIYHVDNMFSNGPPEEKLKNRQNSVKPLVDSFFTWASEKFDKVTKNSETWKGLQYCLNQEKYLRVFLSDPKIPLDNNDAERSIRSFCLGKRNWHIADTINGAKASGILYSIAETAKANQLKPYEYFKHLLTEIPKYMDDKDLKFIDSLLPWAKELPDVCKNQQR